MSTVIKGYYLDSLDSREAVDLGAIFRWYYLFCFLFLEGGESLQPSKVHIKQSLETPSRSASQRAPTCRVGNRSGLQLWHSPATSLFPGGVWAKFLFGWGRGVEPLLGEAFVFILAELALPQRKGWCLFKQAFPTHLGGGSRKFCLPQVCPPGLSLHCDPGSPKAARTQSDRLECAGVGQRCKL